MSQPNTQQHASNQLRQGHMNRQATDESIRLWIDDILDRMLLMATHEHTIIHQDGTETESTCIPQF